MTIKSIFKVVSIILGDVKAVRRGTVHKRIKNRVIGKRPVRKLLK